MKTRIVKKWLLKDAVVAWVPQYKSAWYTPWRQISDEDGDFFASSRPSALEDVCKGVAEGKRPPKYKKPSKVYKVFGD